MKLAFTILCVLILSCQSHKTKSDVDSNSSVDISSNPDELIPVKVKEYVKNNFPGWIFPDTSDYIKSWWSFYNKGQITYFAAADLNDDNKVDYGLLLKNDNSLILVILVDSANTFKHRIFDNFGKKYSGKVKDIVFGVGIEPPGRTDCVVGGLEQSLILRSNGIVLNNYEFKYRIYHWEGENLRVFQVADKEID